MPNISIPKNYAANTTPTEAQLDAVKNAIEEFFNVIKLEASNFSTSSISTTKLADGAVTSPKVPDESVTNAKKAPCNIVSATVTSGTSVTTPSITIPTGSRVWVISAPANGYSDSIITAGQLELKRDSTVIGKVSTASGSFPFGFFVDAPTSGTYTYAIERSGGSGSLTNLTLYAIEI